MTKLAGKVALVTGGARGIGAASAKALAQEGAAVAISYSASADAAEALVKTITAEGGKAAAYRADQADTQAVEALVAAVVKDFGRLDILVNNAGVYAGGALGAGDADAAALDRLYAVNLFGAVAAIRAAARVMADDGRIISIGSALGSRVPMPGLADYSATKAGLAGYTRGAARDLAGRRITVNIIQPGSIDTDMNPESSEWSGDQKAQNVLGRYGRPEEIAAGVIFLASREASFITGATLNIDGGFTS